MTIQTNLRNADLADLARLLQEQHSRKVDMVTPASKLRSEQGVIVVEGAEPELTEDGVTSADGYYLPTAVFDEGIAAKLNIPVAYVRTMRTTRPDLYDANVNGWLHGQVRVTTAVGDAREGGPIICRTKAAQTAPMDPRSFLVRAFRSEGGVGIARAFLSDSYRPIDNLDVLLAAMDGVKQAGVDVAIDGCDLTERRMSVRVVAPQVRALAPTLLANYRSPFTDDEVTRAGRSGGEWVPQDVAGRGTVDPVVFAGFQIGNSETGGGAFTLTPRIVALVCLNGMTITADAIRSIHLGGKLDEGLIRWTEDTQRKSLELVTAKTRDAVATFLDTDYVTRVITRIEEQADAKVSKPQEVITTLSKRLQFDQATADGILDHFIRGGQMTAGGVLNAVTSYAQTVDDADKAQDIEGSALRALELAATS